MLQPGEHQHHTIWTPELVEISLPLAGVARRCIAMLIDQLIVFSFLIGLFITAMITLGLSASYFHQFSGNVFIMAIFGILLLCQILYSCYFWSFHTFNQGQTLGKMWLGIRLVTDRGGRANGWTCFIRSLFDILDMMLFYGGISVMMILMTDKEKRLADFAAGTLVILER